MTFFYLIFLFFLFLFFLFSFFFFFTAVSHVPCVLFPSRFVSLFRPKHFGVSERISRSMRKVDIDMFFFFFFLILHLSKHLMRNCVILEVTYCCTMYDTRFFFCSLWYHTLHITFFSFDVLQHPQKCGSPTPMCEDPDGDDDDGGADDASSGTAGPRGFARLPLILNLGPVGMSMTMGVDRWGERTGEQKDEAVRWGLWQAAGLVFCVMIWQGCRR